MYKPEGNRCIVRIKKRYLKDADGKPSLNEEGFPIFDQEQEGKVINTLTKPMIL